MITVGITDQRPGAKQRIADDCWPADGDRPAPQHLRITDNLRHLTGTYHW